MAQTTGGMSGVVGVVQVSNNNSDWSSISGSANTVTPSGFARQSAEAYTFDGDEAIIGKGKREPLELEVGIVYTELDGEAFDLVWDEFDAEGGDDLWVRYSPGGGDTGDWGWTTTTGTITACLPPTTEAAGGNVIVGAFTVRCASIDKSALAAQWT
jgi:hypothetical protein